MFRDAHRVLSAVLMAAAACLPGHVTAAPVTLLDTYVGAGPTLGPDAGLYARVAVGQAIALPFTVGEVGAVTAVDTGIVLDGGLCGWRIGLIPRAALVGSTGQPGGSNSIWSAFINVNVGGPSGFCPTVDLTAVPFGSFVSLRDLNWMVAAGDYFLVATWLSDMEEAIWYTNSNLRSDQWALQVIGPGALLASAERLRRRPVLRRGSMDDAA
jgi:hypothetical protein